MAISNGVIILLCILGAGASIFQTPLTSPWQEPMSVGLDRMGLITLTAALLIGYAIGTRLWSGSPDDAQDMERGNDFNQAAYMREVRLRNQDKIYSTVRHFQHRGGPYDQPTPAAYSAVSMSTY